MVSTESHGENSTLVETSAPPAIAIVAPTARNPTNHGMSLSSSVAPPCKAHSGVPPP
ncbi:CLUMA_CG014506, isoform A, partial [Clunio marinus]